MSPRTSALLTAIMYAPIVAIGISLLGTGYMIIADVPGGEAVNQDWHSSPW